ncbi:hypothetical protein GCM10009677_08760 [Sphaerisporangium rubeum]|uniref:Uncharacterized protein n=1 Tax=Sphaerisporangium rubeum TaxID=321317 RepID=A0A7X0IK03_9ACTN|nr:hypothetical protein [Sphaerisporangium rubeum]MBB6476617.1 hypothetical protein [Sphaerisporangium rubeum]
MMHSMVLPPRVSPTGLKAYLKANSWQLKERPLPRVEIWERDDHEVLVPLNVDASDYLRRVRNFIEDVASESESSEEDVTRDLQYVEDDVISLKFEDERPYIPLVDASKMLNGAREFAIANACSAIRRKSYHGRSRPAEARKHADIVGMGHTVRGSFIIPIVSPIGTMKPVVADGDQEPLLDVQAERDYFPRRVTGMMADVLRQLQELAVERDAIPSRGELRQAVFGGLSADACSALATMVSAPEVGDLDITVRWALTSAPPRAGGDDLTFPKESAGAIREIGHILRKDVKISDTVVYGFVSSLDRDPDDDEGVVKVKALIGGRVRPIKMALGPDDYHVAVEANDLKLRVVVAGTLYRSEAGRYSMPTVDLFRVDDYLPLEFGNGGTQGR